MRALLACAALLLLLAPPALAEPFPHGQVLNSDSNRNGAVRIENRVNGSASMEREVYEAIYSWEAALAPHKGAGTEPVTSYGYGEAEVIVRDWREGDWAAGCGYGGMAYAEFPYPLYGGGKTLVVLCPVLYDEGTTGQQKYVAHEIGHTIGVGHLTPNDEHAATSLMVPYPYFYTPETPQPIDVGAWERRWLPKERWTYRP